MWCLGTVCLHRHACKHSSMHAVTDDPCLGTRGQSEGPLRAATRADVAAGREPPAGAAPAAALGDLHGALCTPERARAAGDHSCCAHVSRRQQHVGTAPWRLCRCRAERACGAHGCARVLLAARHLGAAARAGWLPPCAASWCCRRSAAPHHCANVALWHPAGADSHVLHPAGHRPGPTCAQAATRRARRGGARRGCRR